MRCLYVEIYNVVKKLCAHDSVHRLCNFNASLQEIFNLLQAR
jgi:hypothetical protein